MKNYIASLFQNKELDGKPLDHWKNVEKGLENDDDAIWKETLSEKEYQVLRGQGTEAPHSSVYDRHLPKKGHYACRACGNSLYSFKHKFESGCGWPAFGKFVQGSIETRDDFSLRVRS
jgi:peptide-methionine (R)-S-oxide reductase